MGTNIVGTLHPSYFELGDTVQVRHLTEAPHMVVKKKFFEGQEKDPHQQRQKRGLERVLCYWFSAGGEYQEKDYDYKDLVVVKRARATAADSRATV